MAGQANTNKHVSVTTDDHQFSQPYNPGNEKESGQGNGKHHRGGESSVKQKKTTDTTADRNLGKVKEKIKSSRATERSINLVVDDVPYFIKVTPFPYNTETRFYINVNGGEDHVFTWDAQLHRLRAIDDSSWLLPDVLENAISEKLQQQK